MALIQNVKGRLQLTRSTVGRRGEVVGMKEEGCVDMLMEGGTVQCGVNMSWLLHSLSMASHLQFAFSLHQRRLISSFPEEKIRVHISFQSTVVCRRGRKLGPACLLLGGCIFANPLPSQRQQEIAIARTTTLASSLVASPPEVSGQLAKSA